MEEAGDLKGREEEQEEAETNDQNQDWQGNNSRDEIKKVFLAKKIKKKSGYWVYQCLANNANK